MSIHDDLEELAALVMSPDFKSSQDAFFERWCGEFERDVDEGTGNKLSYTQIHNDYVTMVEGNIKAVLGLERLDRIMAETFAVALLEKSCSTNGV